MRTIILMSLVLALSGPGGAAAQPAGSDGPNADPGGRSTAARIMRDALQPPVTTLPATEAPVAGRQKAPRSEKAIGPDLMAYVFAPIGGIVNPIARDLHGIDATLAPINEALLPITGPLDPTLFQPAAETVPEATPEPIKPAKVGPRK